MCYFPLVIFRVFPLFLTFIILTIMRPDIILFYFLHLFCLRLLSFLNLLIYVFHQIWEIFSHYFSSSFCVPFSLFSLSGTLKYMLVNLILFCRFLSSDHSFSFLFIRLDHPVDLSPGTLIFFFSHLRFAIEPIQWFLFQILYFFGLQIFVLLYFTVVHFAYISLFLAHYEYIFFCTLWIHL